MHAPFVPLPTGTRLLHFAFHKTLGGLHIGFASFGSITHSTICGSWPTYPVRIMTCIGQGWQCSTRVVGTAARPITVSTAASTKLRALTEAQMMVASFGNANRARDSVGGSLLQQGASAGPDLNQLCAPPARSCRRLP